MSVGVPRQPWFSGSAWGLRWCRIHIQTLCSNILGLKWWGKRLFDLKGLCWWAGKIQMHCWFFDGGWVAGEGPQFFGWPGVLVLLAEVAQGSIDWGGQVFCDELAGEARPGREKFAFIAFIHVVTTGLKQIQWYQIASFFFLSSVEIWTLLADWGKFCYEILWEGDGPMGRINKNLIGQNFPMGMGFPFCE